MDLKRVYVIAGTMCNHKLWNMVQAKINTHIELIHLTIPRDASFNEICKYFNDSITEESINLLGFSLGGYIAAYFSTLFPNKVKRLFIISNSPTKLPVSEVKQRSQMLAFVKNFGYGGLSTHKAKLLLDPGNVTQAHIELLQEMDKDLGPDEFISVYTHTSERHCLKSSLLSLKIPLIYWYSEHDSLINTDWFDSTIEQQTSCEVHVAPGCGHMLPIEQDAQLTRLLIHWLDK
ncbi:alpha/beta hydrolase [Pseudoalteromonas sp. SMS1]|uniref:alpha/beta fold hydrolase n=1 Tax=Pseudoalteromonas sp. SMS1 TaxID=2908894 RepID=UPI001F39D897|nr:alpha/beta hydrolase [Pseudoalteromonas sp. SMS1]MCF2859525.1 alpha/beta hydrolase [Pseudoalteromonas sp. SMS1]